MSEVILAAAWFGPGRICSSGHGSLDLLELSGQVMDLVSIITSHKFILVQRLEDWDVSSIALCCAWVPLLHPPGGMSEPLPLLFSRGSGIDGTSSRGEVYSVSVLFFCASYYLLPCWLIWIDVLVRELLRHWKASQARSS